MSHERYPLKLMQFPKQTVLQEYFLVTPKFCVELKFNQTDHSQIWVTKVSSFVPLNFLPLSHPTVETGPPQPHVIELARVTDRGIRESHMVDVSQLVIEKDKSVVGVFADIVVIDYDGNLFDACSYAATAALLTATTPTWNMVDDKPTKVDAEETPLPTTTIPVSVTMAKIGNHIIVDPNGDEWASMDARITITSNSDGNIVALQKGGNDGFTQDEINQCGEISVRVGAKIREKLQQAQQGAQ